MVISYFGKKGNEPSEEDTMQEIIERAKAIIFRPRETWPIIKEEVATVGDVFRNYVVILAALPPVASFLGLWIFGRSVSFAPGRYHVSFFKGISMAVVEYIVTLVGVYVAALVVEWLAPNFQAQRDRVRAFKLVAYSFTPAFVIGIVNIIPDLAPLTILGLYGFYLLYVGLPYLMECPPERALTYTIAVAAIMFIVYIAIGAITAAIVGLPKV